jgi:hypothetical protein
MYKKGLLAANPVSLNFDPERQLFFFRTLKSSVIKG